MPILRKLPQILHIHRNQPGFLRPPHNPMLQRPRKKLREYGHQVKSHVPSILSNFALTPQATGSAGTLAGGFLLARSNQITLRARTRKAPGRHQSRSGALRKISAALLSVTTASPPRG
jgi:hypothetical protein